MRSCSVAVRLVSVHLVVPHPPKNATIARAVIELARQTIPSCHRSEVFSVSRRNMGELCNLWYNIAATARRMKHSASDRDGEGVYPGGRWRERRVLGRVGSPVEGPACQVHLSGGRACRVRLEGPACRVRRMTFDHPSRFRGSEGPACQVRDVTFDDPF